MKNICLCMYAFLLILAGCKEKEPASIRLAFISGMNPIFNEELYAPLLEDFKEITWKAYTTEESIELFKPVNKDQYDVLIFHDICLEEIPDITKQQIAQIIYDGKPVMIHHDGLLTYNEWPEFARIAGMKYFMSPQEVEGVPQGVSTYKHEQDIPIQIVDERHFITKGMEKEFILHDEIYGNMWKSPDIHVLWTTTHPDSDKEVLYTHSYGKGKVVGIVMGHGPDVFHDKNYQTAFRRSILWLAGRMEN